MTTAEELFRAEHPRRFAHSPYERTPQLTDLWPCDQERYRRMADALNEAKEQPHGD